MEKTVKKVTTKASKVIKPINVKPKEEVDNKKLTTEKKIKNTKKIIESTQKKVDNTIKDIEKMLSKPDKLSDNKLRDIIRNPISIKLSHRANDILTDRKRDKLFNKVKNAK